MRSKKIAFSIIVVFAILAGVYFAIESYRSNQSCGAQGSNSTLFFADYSLWIKNPEDLRIISEKANTLNDYLSLRSKAQQKFESQEKELLTETERFTNLYAEWDQQRREFKSKLGGSSSVDLIKIQQALSMKNDELILITEILPDKFKSFSEDLRALVQADKNFQNIMKGLVETLTSIDQRDQALDPEKPSLFKRFKQWELEQKGKCTH